MTSEVPLRGPRVFVDAAQNEIARVVTERAFRIAARIEILRLDHLVRERVLNVFGKLPRGPEEITGYLHRVRAFIELEAYRQVARYSPMRWLWYLRRLPRFVFEGRVQTTFAYHSSVAETLTAASRTTDQYRVENGFLVYRIKPVTMQPVLELAVTASYLSDVHSYLRWAGKGCEFDFSRLALGQPVPSADQRHAVDLYDERCANSGSFLGRLGTVVSGISRGRIRNLCSDGYWFRQRCDGACAGRPTGGITICPRNWDREIRTWV